MSGKDMRNEGMRAGSDTAAKRLAGSAGEKEPDAIKAALAAAAAAVYGQDGPASSSGEARATDAAPVDVVGAEPAAKAPEPTPEAAAPEPAPEPAPEAPSNSTSEPADDAPGTPIGDAPASGGATAKMPMAGWLGIAVAALIIGLLIGMFALNGGAGASSSLTGKTSVPESQLDTAIASYTYKGTTTDITVREVIQQQSSLSSAQNEDGSYQLPTADAAVSVARNLIILAEAENRGLSATDEEIAEYAEETLGSDNYASIAASYSMDEDAVVTLLTNSCVMNKLRDEISSGTSSEAVMPEAPPEPNTQAIIADEDEDSADSASSASASADSGSSSSSSSSSASSASAASAAADEDEASEPDEADGEDTSANAAQQAASETSPEYAAYIIELAGDEWDAAADTWASPDGPYATALAKYKISKKGASYEAATEAYYVAYQQYADSMSASTDAWTNFANELMSQASIVVYTLLA